MGVDTPFSAYHGPIQLFEYLLRDTKQTINSSTLGIYQLPARSYVAPPAPTPKLERKEAWMETMTVVRRKKQGQRIKAKIKKHRNKAGWS